jgi:hypothetical protein
MRLEIGDHLAERFAAGLLRGFNVHILLRHRNWPDSPRALAGRSEALVQIALMN